MYTCNNTCVLYIYSLDHSPELETLNIGDCILEVNGLSVKESSLEMVIHLNDKCKVNLDSTMKIESILVKFKTF